MPGLSKAPPRPFHTSLAMTKARRPVLRGLSVYGGQSVKWRARQQIFPTNLKRFGGVCHLTGALSDRSQVSIPVKADHDTQSPTCLTRRPISLETSDGKAWVD